VFGFMRRATPGPVSASIGEAGVQRVVEDVVDRRFELSFVPDHPRPEALGEERAEAAVAGVVLPRVVAMEPLHRSRELLRRAFHDEVVVGRHQAPGLEAEAEAPDRGPEVEQEEAAVEVVPVERSLADAARGDVEVSVGQTRTQHASHAAIVPSGVTGHHPANHFLPTSDTPSRAATGVRHPSWLGGAWL
jgi:hypothetical protein